ncbi:hypothetical protein AAF712_013670 [Marasmius tenuissimus]|uniref:CCHC-type domain-containing protein n=1 Tax=Marasmius tenuissimus TaxID=585030 RepID=A0ABR2ZF56_9AGAR
MYPSEEVREHQDLSVDTPATAVKNNSSQVPVISGDATPVIQQPVPTYQRPTQPIPPSSPMFYPSEPIRRPNPEDPERVWKERVGLQRVRNSQQRTFGRTEIPDQGIGFDEDSLPVDKNTTPREVWDRDYREAQRDGRNNNSRPPSENQGTQPPNNFMGGAAGGNPGDPGDDSSDNDDRRSNRDRRKNDKHPDKGRRRTTPWDDESSSDDESNYSTDSVFSELEDESEDDTKGRRRRRCFREAKMFEIDKLDDHSRRRWRKRLHHKYRVQIREAVGEMIPYIEGLKNIKIKEPDSYQGSDDIEVFDDWFLVLLRWRIVNRMGGPDLDVMRVQCTGMMVSKKALQFFNDEISSPHRMKKSWSFEDVIIGLFDHCVAATTIHQAAKRFDKVKYDAEMGIQEFYSTLKRWASRMPNRPDKYTFKRRFLDGLPKNVIREMIRHGAVPDYANVKTMVKAVQRYEDDRALQEYYLEGKSNEPGPKPQPARSESRPKTPPSGEKARIVNGARYKVVKKSHLTRQSNGKFVPKYQYTSTKAAFGSRAPPQNSTKPDGEKKTPICYGCGTKGHYASDPKCPRYGQPRLFAIDDGVDQPEQSPSNEDMGIQDDNVQSEAESSEGEYVAISDYEDYGAYIDGRDSDLDEFLGMILENPNTYNHIDEIYDPLTDCGPPTIIEEGQDELFPTLDLENHSYVMTDKLFSIEDDGDPNIIKYSGRLRRSTRQLDRPDRGPAADRRPLVALININGKPALTLFDSGCTLECISPGFARVANVKVHQLAKQHSLQLGTVGSRAKFNYGTIVDTAYDQIKEKTYFDVVNIDRYDAIVGTYFMRKNGISLDFGGDTIRVKGKPSSTLSVGEGEAELRRRSAMRRDMKSKEFQRQDNPN